MNTETIYAGIDERERLFNEYLAQDRKVLADFKFMVYEKINLIQSLEERLERCELELRDNAQKLSDADKLIECLRNVLKNIVEDFPKSEWKDRTTYRIACEYAKKEGMKE